MQFRTELTLSPSREKLALDARVLTIGSCFAEVLGYHLAKNKVSTLTNPFGTIFNPLSMLRLLQQTLDNQSPDETLYVQHQGVWFHYDFHSSLWDLSREALASKLEQRLLQVRIWLTNTDWLMLTFGTAYGYYLNQEELRLVANCHKTPNPQFTKALLNVAQIMDAFEALHSRLQTINPSLQVILTVSPVRHTRDTLPLNQVSKSVLRLACHYLEEHHESVKYFPAYELLLDDLRDYRFYEADLIHPNQTGQDYILEKFSQTYFDQNLLDFVAEWQKIRAGLAHRPLQPGTENHRLFLENLLQKLQKLAEKVDVRTEMEQIRAQQNELPPP
jgi:lysophospholipase L1-like esterase